MNADACINNRERQRSIRTSCYDLDLTFVWCELDGIGQQVDQHLLHRTFVGFQHNAGLASRRELDAGFLRARAYKSHHVIHNTLYIKRLEFEIGAPGFDFGHVENVVDHVEQELPAAPDVGHIFDVFW